MGLVSISSGCDHIEPWGAISIPALGALWYCLFTIKLQLLKIDDPINTSAVHFIGGFWGLIATAFFDNDNGLFYFANGKGHYLGYQICGAIVIIGWVSVFCVTFFLAMTILDLLRIDKAQEVLGMDNCYLGGMNSKDYSMLKKGLEKKIEEEEKELQIELAKIGLERLEILKN